MKTIFYEDTEYMQGKSNRVTRKELIMGLSVMTELLHRVLWVLPPRKLKALRKFMDPSLKSV